MKIAGPMCCGQDSVWVDMGPKLQYFYCRECKNEVKDTGKRDYTAPNVYLDDSWAAELLKDLERNSTDFGNGTPPSDTFLSTGFPRIAKRGELDAEESFELSDEEDSEPEYHRDPFTFEGAD